MRTIDLTTWPRRTHYLFFKRFEQPEFGMSANVDVTALYPFVKERGYSFTTAITYILSRAANAISEFRQRIRGDAVVEHEVVHPSTTILGENDLFGFCKVEYTQDFAVFAARAEEQMAGARAHPTLSDEPGQDDLLFMSPIPWVAFTTFLHPLPTQPPDSVPRFAWGKRFQDAAALKMPLAVQAHHALMDGVHMGWFYEAVQEYLLSPGSFLAG